MLSWLLFLGLGTASALTVFLLASPSNRLPVSEAPSRNSAEQQTLGKPAESHPPMDEATPPLSFLASNTPRVLSRNPGYVGREACKEYHLENFQTASQANHFRACPSVNEDDMPPGSQGEVSSFNSSHGNARFQLRQEGDSFWMDTYSRSRLLLPSRNLCWTWFSAREASSTMSFSARKMMAG